MAYPYARQEKNAMCILTLRHAQDVKAVIASMITAHTDGRLFSTVAPTLEKCREKRDLWLQTL